ncbi:MAG: CorA family divalent cation transporter [Gemmatimonadales bacterium]
MHHRVAGPDGFTWIDVVGPTREELQELAQQYGLPPTVVEDCLDPDHLPKFERLGDATFLILRVHDDAAPDDAGTIQELTRKVAVFFRLDFMITVHRVELHEVSRLRDRFSAPTGHESCELTPLLYGLGHATLDSYDAPLARDEQTLDRFEAAIFDRGQPPSLQQAHNLKRRVSLTRRILFQTTNVLQKLVPPAGRTEPLFQDLRESVDAYLFWADQLLEEVNLLLQVHLAMASHRTNEVMRVLTVFSAFFLPLTFIVGVYGMNFHYMPELSAKWGYPAVLGMMLAVAAGIWLWFRKKGWLT